MFNKKLFLYSFLVFAVFGFFFCVNFTEGANNIPTRTEINWPTSPSGKSPSFGMDIFEFFMYLYELAVGMAGVFLFGVLVYSGIQYLFISIDPNKLKEVKDRISKALLSILILFSPYLILKTINPGIVDNAKTIPNLWEEIEFEELNIDDIKEPSCAFVVFYKEKDWEGSSSGRVYPGESVSSDLFEYHSFRSYRLLTTSEKENIENIKKYEKRNIIDDAYIEGHSCKVNYYAKSNWWPFSAPDVVASSVGGSPNVLNDEDRDIKKIEIVSISQ